MCAGSIYALLDSLPRKESEFGGSSAGRAVDGSRSLLALQMARRQSSIVAANYCRAAPV